jgi:hypothetical protein
MQVLRIKRSGKCGWRCAQALLSFGLALGLYAAQPEIGIKIPEPNPTLSEFRDDPKFGKDPFFPNTGRRQVINEVQTEAFKLPEIDKIKLGGISGSQENRLAILNNRTFGIGEEAEIKVDGRSVRIRLIEIRTRSVMISFNGGPPQELLLGQRF